MGDRGGSVRYVLWEIGAIIAICRSCMRSRCFSRPGSVRLGNRVANGWPKSISAGEGSSWSTGVARMFRRASCMLLNFFRPLLSDHCFEHSVGSSSRV